MLIRYSPDPDSYFTLIDYCLRIDARDIDFRCERPWTTVLKQTDLFSCAEPDALFATADVRLLPHPNKAQELRSTLARTAPFSEQDILFAFLSVEAIEACIVDFARIALSGDMDRLCDENDEVVRTVLRAARRVRKEIHAFQGLLRFTERTSGLLEARFEPDNDICGMLFPFFEARFGSIPFLIVDMIRSKQAGSNAIGEKEELAVDDEWKSLWRVFYASTENQQRLNPKLRLQHAPKRYWKYLPELNDES
jgi:probable DNA metabolism protein